MKYFSVMIIMFFWLLITGVLGITFLGLIIAGELGWFKIPNQCLKVYNQ
jgi:hypothetical protein